MCFCFLLLLLLGNLLDGLLFGHRLRRSRAEKWSVSRNPTRLVEKTRELCSIYQSFYFGTWETIWKFNMSSSSLITSRKKSLRVIMKSKAPCDETFPSNSFWIIHAKLRSPILHPPNGPENRSKKSEKYCGELVEKRKKEKILQVSAKNTRISGGSVICDYFTTVPPEDSAIKGSLVTSSFPDTISWNPRISDTLLWVSLAFLIF